MRQLIPVLILVFSHFLLKNLHAQSLVSAGGFGGTTAKVLEGMAVDAGGNFYTVGGFESTVDFDPGPGTLNLTAPPGAAAGTDIFIVKQSAKGDLLWAKQLGASGIDVARAVTVNPLGFVEIAGDFPGNR